MLAAPQLAEWSTSLDRRDLTDEVTDAVTRHLLDGLGSALGAIRRHEGGPAATVARSLGGPPEARIPGTDERLGAVAAAFATGALVHAMDFDDTYATGLVHASAVILPAVVSVAQQVGSSGADVVAAAAVGYEAMCRLSAASPNGFHARGLHATSVVGPSAAALVAARLTGLDAATTTHALGISGSFAGGLLEFLADGSSTKQLHPGAAASAGILAARLAAAGASGPASVLEGRFGLYSALSERAADPVSIVADLGRRWELTRMTVKPYPACQLIHASLDAVRSIGAVDGEIRCISATVHPDAVPVVGEPRAGKVSPRSSYDAKFSLAWSVAAALVDGKVDLDTYCPESIARPDVAALADRVQLEVVDSGVVAADAPARVTVHTEAGGRFEGRATRSSGSPDNPLTLDELVAKFHRNTGGGDSSARLASLVLSLAELPDLDAVLDAAAATIRENS
jgi:2-methylcitrate dehydratase PrpD